MEWNGMEWNGMEWNGMEWTNQPASQPTGQPASHPTWQHENPHSPKKATGSRKRIKTMTSAKQIVTKQIQKQKRRLPFGELRKVPRPKASRSSMRSRRVAAAASRRLNSSPRYSSPASAGGWRVSMASPGVEGGSKLGWVLGGGFGSAGCFFVWDFGVSAVFSSSSFFGGGGAWGCLGVFWGRGLLWRRMAQPGPSGGTSAFRQAGVSKPGTRSRRNTWDNSSLQTQGSSHARSKHGELHATWPF